MAVGPYVVESELARGGMGAVYRARRRHDGALVALKVLDAGPAVTSTQQERFKREGEVAARLAHPGIVRVHDAGAVSWLCYLAMDLIDGAPLGDLAGRVPPLEAARLLAQVARAVEHAHAHGVVHRDLKPSNVLVRKDDGRALVTDFGIAREQGSSALTKTGALVGTPTYFSPEQADGRPATAKSDVHALGAILYELLTGAPPFDRDDLPSLLVAITRERPAPPSALAPAVPRSLDRVCLAALAKSPDARPSAGELAAELEAIASGRPEPRGRAARWVALGAVFGVALVAGARVVVTGPTPPPAPAPIETPEASPTPAPPATESAPWVEPRWLRAVRARGDTGTLLAALEALDAEPAVDARTRAEASEVLADLDGRWVEPGPLDDGRDAALDHLLWLHALWQRVEPAHRLPPARARSLAENDMWAFGASKESAHQMKVGSALVKLAPEHITGYLVYASGNHVATWEQDDGALLRAGTALAVAQRNGVAWGLLAADYSLWLGRVVANGTPEQRRDARAANLALARSAMTDGALDPTAAMHLLAGGTALVERDEALAFLAHAEELCGGPTIWTHQARARQLSRDTRDPRALELAAREADRALELILAGGRNPIWIAQTVRLALDMWLAGGHREGALATIDRGLAAGPGQPGLALSRLLLLRELGAPLSEVQAAHDSYVARLGEALEQRGADRPLLEAALVEARLAAQEPARLDRWAARVVELDPGGGR
jgi:hypothetical protein